MPISELETRAGQIRKHIQETNDEFNAAPVARKRVMLAQDVLLQLKSRRMVADSVYFNPEEQDSFAPLVGARTDEELRDALRGIHTCGVCGIGSLFVAAVERLDQLRVSEIMGEGFGPWSGDFKRKILSYLDDHRLFTNAELDAVENLFEWSEVPDSMPNFRAWQALNERDEMYLPALTSIMETIVATRGEEEVTLELLMGREPPDDEEEDEGEDY